MKQCSDCGITKKSNCGLYCKKCGYKYRKTIGFRKGHPFIKGAEKGWFKKGNIPPKWKGGRETHKGYILLIKHGHPMAKSRGRIREHRLVMSEFLDRNLLPEEVVHHKNGNKMDNRIENLVLFKNHSGHKFYEWRKK